MLQDLYTISDQMPRQFVVQNWQSADDIDNVNAAAVLRLKRFYAACGSRYAPGLAAACPKTPAGPSAPALPLETLLSAGQAGAYLWYRMDLVTNVGTAGSVGIIVDVGQQIAVLDDPALTATQKVLRLLDTATGGALTEAQILNDIPAVSSAVETALAALVKG